MRSDGDAVDDAGDALPAGGGGGEVGDSASGFGGSGVGGGGASKFRRWPQSRPPRAAAARTASGDV